MHVFANFNIFIMLLTLYVYYVDYISTMISKQFLIEKLLILYIIV